jgi:hypothetical protein
MKLTRLLLAASVIMTITHRAWGSDPQSNATLTVILDLTDGSRVIGTPGVETVAVQTPYAKMNVPLKQIRTITMGEDHETAAISLQNGDRLNGVITLVPITLETVFGKVAISSEHIRVLSVRATGGALSESLRKGLVLYYSFDRDEGGKVTDLSAGGNHGTVTGAKFSSAGKNGGAYDFSGNEGASVSFDPKALAGSRAVTVSAWFKSFGDSGDWEEIIGCSTEEGNVQTPVCFLWFSKTGLGDNTHSRVLIDKDAGGRESFAIAPTKPASFFRDGRWHHVALTWNGTQATYYIDGARDASQPTSAGTLAYVGDRRSLIGNGWAFEQVTHNFNGLIDEVMIYNRVLTDDELRTLHGPRK